MNKRDFRKARRRIDVSVGESVRILRELQELSQNQLADLTGIPQSTISAIENNRINLGVERAKVISTDAGKTALAVISAVGTRAYYTQLGFERGTLYQQLPLLGELLVP